MDDRSLIATLSTLGPFFAIESHVGNPPPDAPWQPLSRLLRSSGVRERIDQIRAALAATGGREAVDLPWRVVASVAHLGLAARLISPQVGALIFGGRISLDPLQTWWQPLVGRPVPLSVSSDALGSSESGEVVEGVVRTLTELFMAESVSPRVLWGNVASALNGAYNAIVSVRPEMLDAVRLQVLIALEHPLLAGMSTGRPGPTFRRTNCCLIYRLDSVVRGREARQVCGDCVLRSPRSAEI